MADLTDAELARQLGIDKAQVCRLKKRGMPTHSFAAADAWRRENVRLRMTPTRGDGGAAARAAHAVRRFIELRDAAEAALKVGLFDRLAPELRAAMRAVPESEREGLELSFELWDALCLPTLHALGLVGSAWPDSVAPEPGEPDPTEGAGPYLYQIACGELVMTAPAR